MHLRQWASNCAEILKDLSTADNNIYLTKNATATVTAQAYKITIATATKTANANAPAVAHSLAATSAAPIKTTFPPATAQATATDNAITKERKTAS
ncbi:hypothetical protein M0804_013508 [Polistes exclamans]|nr:hypothetical protein M0804_013508 [Polistes exclamans]